MNTVDLQEASRDAQRALEQERDRYVDRITEVENYLKVMDCIDELLAENERQKEDIEQLQAENEDLHQQLEDKDLKLNELGKFTVNMAKKSPQEFLEKAFRIYLNTSKRKTQAKREVARAQLLDFITTAKLEMPDDIMDMLDHLDDEQPESAPTTNVTVQAGGINVQQTNTVTR